MLPTSNAEFWKTLDTLMAESEIVIDRPKHSRHPKYPEMIYPLDYGYLAGTSSMDGKGVDLWRGSLENGKIQGIIVTVDLWKRDSEIKLLVGMTEEEISIALDFMNEPGVMAGMLVRREA